MIKREPGTLGARRWSLYSRLFLRHFNELDHEFNSRYITSLTAFFRFYCEICGFMLMDLTKLAFSFALVVFNTVFVSFHKLYIMVAWKQFYLSHLSCICDNARFLFHMTYVSHSRS